jgi:ABC-type branched-subunit amino acid transport system ATPase component
MSLLQATELYAGYGGTEILHGVSMRLEPGEFVTVIGPNGAGKSTLIKTIIGLIKPQRGTVVFRDRPITGSNPEDLVVAGLAYIPQTNNTFATLTVRENLEMGAISRRPSLTAEFRPARLMAEARRLISRRHKTAGEAASPEDPKGRVHGWYTRDEFEARVRDICGIFPNLEPKLDTKVHMLSGGEQQMVALARALVLDPKVLLVDEPSAGLAPRLVAMIFQKIKDINAQGVGVVLVEQNARKALSLADRGYVLEAGKNRYEGPGKALLVDPQIGRLYLGG